MVDVQGGFEAVGGGAAGGEGGVEEERCQIWSLVLKCVLGQ